MHEKIFHIGREEESKWEFVTIILRIFQNNYSASPILITYFVKAHNCLFPVTQWSFTLKVKNLLYIIYYKNQIKPSEETGKLVNSNTVFYFYLNELQTFYWYLVFWWSLNWFSTTIRGILQILVTKIHLFAKFYLDKKMITYFFIWKRHSMKWGLQTEGGGYVPFIKGPETSCRCLLYNLFVAIQWTITYTLHHHFLYILIKSLPFLYRSSFKRLTYDASHGFVC